MGTSAVEGTILNFCQLLSFTYPVPRHVVEVHGEAWTAVENIVTKF
ncbi:MAG: hypothetical protein ACE5LU_05610 [Anaerolineae bacterium]